MPLEFTKIVRLCALHASLCVRVCVRVWLHVCACVQVRVCVCAHAHVLVCAVACIFGTWMLSVVK